MTIRTEVQDKVLDILLEMRRPTKKIKVDLDLLINVETLHDYSSMAVNGEHLWLGIIYTDMMHQFYERDLDFNLLDSKATLRAKNGKGQFFR